MNGSERDRFTDVLVLFAALCFRYIADASSGFIGKDADPRVDGLVAGIFGNVFETFAVGGCA